MDASLSIFLKYTFLLTIFSSCTGQIVFTAEPRDAIVAPNLPLQIPCTASTTLSGTLHILWKRNSTWIVDYNRKHYRQLHNGSLQFDRFLYGDQGLYQCSAMVIDASHNHLGQIYSRNATIIIAYIHNTFTIHPETRSAQLGSIIQLQCLSPKSDPIATIYWEKDAMKLTGYENGSIPLLSEKILSSTLIIRNLSNKDTGSYKCVAYNRLLPGKVVNSNAGVLTIAARQEQPYFEKRPTSAVASRFQSFIWECRIRGIPEPTVQWYHNGQPITYDQNRMKLASGSLHFVSVREEYNGSYVCEGSNTLGKISSQSVAFVVAFIDYDFVTDPSTTIVTYGDTLLLRCTPPRRYPLAVTITWYKDYAEMVLGSTISVTGDNSLRIASITRSSEGVYFCQAYNSVTKETRTSKTATVSVRVLPRIQTILANTSVVVGDTVTKTCTANGHPAPSIKWQKGNVVISNNGNLVLSNVSLSDSGYYVCIATNPAGNDSKRFYLHVSTKPLANVVPSNQTRIVGQSVEFHCEFVGTPKPITLWYFVAKGSSARQLVTFGSHVSKTASGVRIGSVRKLDEGRYICNGNSSGGSLEVYAFLIVHVPPTFVIRPRNQTTSVSSSFTLQCQAAGDPSPTTTWLFSSNVLSNGAKYQITSNSLTVRNVVVADMGWYTCRISNVAGNQAAIAFVDVQVSPTITEFSMPQRVRFGDRFTITCKGDGNPPPNIQWKRNSTFNLEIDGSRLSRNQSNIVIAQARPTDSGTYQCILTNVVGNAVRNSTLIVQVLPHPPSSLTARAVLSTAIIVHWAAGFDGFSTILRFQLEMLRHGTMPWQTVESNITRQSLNYTATGLMPFTVYEFRMKSYTAIGQSVYSAVVSARTLEDAPSVPLNVQVVVINASSAVIRWSPPANPNGNITFYQIKYGIVGNSEFQETTIRVQNKTMFETQIKSLQPFTRYQILARAATISSNIPNWGNYSSAVFFRTSEAVPSGAPTIQNITSPTSTSISVPFSALQDSLTNGVLTGYVVTVVLGSVKKLVTTNDTRVTVGSLQKATRYGVYVKACTRIGCGPNSKIVMVSTLEDVPGVVINPTVVADSSTAILIKWLEPAEKNGIITGYVVTIRNASKTAIENTTLPANQLELRKDGLRSNTTYFVAIAAKTKIGIGAAIPEIAVNLNVTPTIPVTPSVVVKSTEQPSTSPSTTKKVITVVRPDAQTSTDWLHEKNLPILIGVSVAIFVLLIVVIVLITWTCSRRVKSREVKRERWLSTSTQSGAENPAFIPNGNMELKRPRAKSPDQMENQEIVVTDPIDDHDDFVFENDSEPSQIMENVNPSNQYAFDDTIRFKEKDDSSPLVKLRNVEVDLSDDASEYDKPYSSIDEVCVPDMFAFIDEEDRKSVKSTPDTQSMKDPSDPSANDYVINTDVGEVSSIQNDNRVPSRGNASPADLTWDTYDTSKAVVHDPDENPYDLPATEEEVPTNRSPFRSNRRQRYDDESQLIGDEETVI